ncbi:MAG: N-acetylmuramoyl-L-alanine amidase [Methyloceanibacter sp.]|uniref:N-acetylmuramoyl-L-alanine amidase n=1 Tax=Methyloceanibacter sp. TaxID=1965321 RepID=UPI003D6D1F54
MRALRALIAVALSGVMALMLSAVLPLLAGAPSHAQSKGTIAKDARLAGDRERTRFIADLSRKVDVHVFALGNPYRVIVDAPDVNFQMPPGIGKERRGLVTAYRYGLFAPGKSRIVIDVSGPFLIDKVFVLEPRDDQPARLVIDLVPTDEQTFLTKLREAKPLAESQATHAPLPQPPERPADAKPIVVLDAGHGGVDPGTSSANGVTEKEVVLQFAKRLKEKLTATGRYEVHLTRDDDTFLPLQERVAFAQKKGAGLFLSIHADYFPITIDKARGATVYTLSEQASDEEARALAAKENFSDVIAGVELPSDSDEVVANILIDLAQRETQNRSVVFARSIVGELATKGTLHTKRLRSAGFRVLKAPDVPSVLLELGFLSNPDDEKQLTSDSWRDRMTDSVTAAIDDYFAKRIARMPY